MTTIPLDDDDMAKLTALSFMWDCSPQEALKRALAASMSAQLTPAGPDEKAPNVWRMFEHTVYTVAVAHGVDRGLAVTLGSDAATAAMLHLKDMIRAAEEPPA
jgi:hypothetical protein